MTSTSTPRILFATIAAGGSHVSSAQAMSEAVVKHVPHSDTSVTELMIDLGFEKFDRRHKEGWKRALRNPWSIVWGQALVDRFPYLTVTLQRWFLREFAKCAAERLKQDRPDLIVVNHAWLAVALTLAQTEYDLDIPILTFETSPINTNGLWADRRAERFMVGSAVSKERLIRFGVLAERIDVVGYPVRHAFLEAPPAREARERLGLADRFTVLVALGGEGEGGAPEIVIETLRNLDPSLQVVVIVGRNQALKEVLEGSYSNMPHLHVEGFTDRMATFVAASDVTIAKTGPATVCEILAVGRPIIAPSRYGGDENVLIDILDREGLGHYAPDPRRLADAVQTYRDSSSARAAFARKVEALDFRGMSERVGSYICHYASTRTVDTNVIGRGLPFSR